MTVKIGFGVRPGARVAAAGRNFALCAPWWPFVSLNSSVSRAFGSLPLVANITDATGFTNPLLLPFQLCTPLGLVYGWLCGASYDHQTDYPYKSNRGKAH